MNIAINTRFLLPRKMEGFGWFTYEIVKRMVISHPEHTFYFFFDRAYSSKFLFADNVIPIVLSPQARHPILFKIWFDYSVTKALKKYKIDLFFSPDGYLSLKTDVKQIGVIHDLNFEHHPEDIPAWPRRYLKNNFIKFAQKAKHLITVSEYSKQDIVKMYDINPEKITVAYNAPSHHFKPISDQVRNQTKNNLTKGEDYFVYVGAIHPRKNIDRLLSAFSNFTKETKSKTKLVIVGENLWSSDQEKKLDNVVFTGHVEISKLAKILGSAKALCLVSYFEGFGIPLVEAMAAEVPILAGNLTALPEICEDAAVLVSPFSVEEIKNGLVVLDENSGLRDELVQKGKARVKAFNWNRSSDIIWEKIEDELKNV